MKNMLVIVNTNDMMIWWGLVKIIVNTDQQYSIVENG